LSPFRSLLAGTIPRDGGDENVARHGGRIRIVSVNPAGVEGPPYVMDGRDPQFSTANSRGVALLYDAGTDFSGHLRLRWIDTTGETIKAGWDIPVADSQLRRFLSRPILVQDGVIVVRNEDFTLQVTKFDFSGRMKWTIADRGKWLTSVGVAVAQDDLFIAGEVATKSKDIENGIRVIKLSNK
jgi:hypothetical protein